MHPLLSLGVAFLLFSATLKVGQDDPDDKKRQAELNRERQKLEHNLNLASQAIAKIAGENVIACTKFRSSVEESPEVGNTETAMNAVCQVFLRNGLLLYPLEDERPLRVTYKSGKLPPGLHLSSDDLKYVQSKKKNKFVLQPQFSASESILSITLTLFDLEKGTAPFSTKVAALPFKSLTLEETCTLDTLPFLNMKILMLAAAYFGRQVDTGECFDLPAKAISDNGGRMNHYEFGTSIKWEDALPGDVVTFGKGGATGGHVMVLYKWNKVRGKATMLHQNWNGNRFVGFGKLGDTEANKKGQEFALWRPIRE
jgi:hypothetical protein